VKSKKDEGRSDKAPVRVKLAYDEMTVRARKMRYAVVIEKAKSNYSAYVPDLPGCVATGETVELVEAKIREAIRFHINGLKADGFPIPTPTSITGYVNT